MQTRPGMWDCARIRRRCCTDKTKDGWLEIYSGADFNHRYCLGAVLFDLKDPSVVLARSIKPILQPEADYELTGFFGNVGIYQWTHCGGMLSTYVLWCF